MDWHGWFTMGLLTAMLIGLAGYSHLAALFVVATGLRDTGISAFLNNTTVVAVTLIPVIWPLAL